jgi:sugar O-acyltransferase (sialic acid O-acetyltransferase NeuD family)
VSYPVIIIGAGGHAKVLIDALLPAEVLGLTDANPERAGQLLLGLPVIGSDDVVAQYPPTTIRLVNGLGSVRAGYHRKSLFERFKREGYQFASVIHPSVVIARDVVLSEGVQIMAAAVVQSGCHIGKNTIINTRAVVDHDCHIGSHVHIAPGAILSGGVDVGENAHIGTGATVIQGIRIGRNSLVAAGAVVIRDVPEDVTVAGVPAREIKL